MLTNKKGRQKAAPKSHTSNHSANHHLQGITPIEEGQSIGDILPAFVGVTNEIHTGTATPACASCRKPFGAVRKRRKGLSAIIFGQKNSHPSGNKDAQGCGVDDE